MTEIEIRTALGSIGALVFEERAPLTSAHFLSYVRDGHYDGSSFYRSLTDSNQPANDARIRVIEGGFCDAYYDGVLRDCFTKGFDMDKTRRGPKPTIRVETTSETGLAHLDGTLSLGRCSADSVDDSFFICIGDQPHLDFGGKRHPDGLGFSAFGRVTGGMDVVLAINALPVDGQRITEGVRIISVLSLGVSR
jgi:peptidyl-prolyl cis-trans isomerase A (cyclophilin A)